MTGSRAAVVIVQEGRVALIRRVREGRTYYLFPGGTHEAVWVGLSDLSGLEVRPPELAAKLLAGALGAEP